MEARRWGLREVMKEKEGCKGMAEELGSRQKVEGGGGRQLAWDISGCSTAAMAQTPSLNWQRRLGSWRRGDSRTQRRWARIDLLLILCSSSRYQKNSLI